MAKWGYRQPLLDSAALAVTAVGVGVLVDALGFGGNLSGVRPGGTIGYRNAAGHFLALGIPLLILQSVASRSVRRRLALFSLMICAAALLLTRTRAAWLGCVPGALMPLIVLGVTPAQVASVNNRGRLDVRGRGTRRRSIIALLFALARFSSLSPNA